MAGEKLHRHQGDEDRQTDRYRWIEKAGGGGGGGGGGGDSAYNYKSKCNKHASLGCTHINICQVDSGRSHTVPHQE